MFLYLYMMKLKYRVFIFTIVLFIFYIIFNYVLNDKHNLNLLSVNNRIILNENNANFRNNYVISDKGNEYIEKNPVEIRHKILNETLTRVVLAVVACGDRLHETLVMIKSAILFASKINLRIAVVADDDLIQSFDEKLKEWKDLMNHSFAYEVHPISFPSAEGNEWRKLFKPCAAQRLFLPSLLAHIDSVLYVDTDSLFLAPLDDIWSHFETMNTTQMAALAPEHEDPNTGWYNRFARHPFYGKLGVNSGVMLMNLTRMRQFGWEKYLSPIYKEFKLKITWGDQDIINIIFHYHPEKLLLYSCRYNYRPDHCMYMSVCRDAVNKGVAVLHGSRGTFHSDKQPAFQSIYHAMEEFQLGSDPFQNLVLPLESYLEQTSTTNCGKLRHIFTKNLHTFIPQKETFR